MWWWDYFNGTPGRNDDSASNQIHVKALNLRTKVPLIVPRRALVPQQTQQTMNKTIQETKECSSAGRSLMLPATYSTYCKKKKTASPACCWLPENTSGTMRGTWFRNYKTFFFFFFGRFFFFLFFFFACSYINYRPYFLSVLSPEKRRKQASTVEDRSNWGFSFSSLRLIHSHCPHWYPKQCREHNRAFTYL